MKRFLIFAVLITVIGSPLSVLRSQSAVNPRNYGLLEAKDGKERYKALERCHREAIEKNLPISYQGIDTIRLEVPVGAYSIPLPHKADFANVVFVVKNCAGKHIALFSLFGESEPAKINIDRSILCGSDFRQVKEFKSGSSLLIIRDRMPWSAIVGRGDPVYRSDLLYIKDGKAVTSPICHYSDSAAKPSCTFVPVTEDLKTISNYTLVRDQGSKYMTFALHVANQFNVVVNNIHVITPTVSATSTPLTGDQVFSILNSANVHVKDITVDNTYSTEGRYGFAFSLSNVNGCSFERVKVVAPYSPFETYNIQDVVLDECDISRFELLCYGRDITISRCNFKDKSPYFSSLYGNLVYENCTFEDCTPVVIRSMYNAYTPFDIKLRRCTYKITRNYHEIVNVMLYSTTPNKRPELTPRCWPNIDIEDLTVDTKQYKRLDIISPSGVLYECNKPFDYLSHININGLRSESKGKPSKCDLYFSKHRFRTVEPFSLNYENIEIGGGEIVNYINKSSE